MTQFVEYKLEVSSCVMESWPGMKPTWDGGEQLKVLGQCGHQDLGLGVDNQLG